nr:pyridoxal phosphate-dependent aminotransferase [bacterium]
MHLSRRSTSVAPSMTLEIDSKAKAMKADGHDVIGFGAGEPDFPTASWIKDAARRALDLDMTRYTPAAGTEDLRKAICDKLQSDNQLSYSPAQIVVSNGAKHALYNAFMAILDPGDEVIIPAPYWVSYPEMVRLADGVPVFVQTREEEGFNMTAEAFEKAITPKTRALVLTNPGNPCGNLYRDEEIKALCRVALAHDLWIVSDEIYEELVYDTGRPMSIAAVSPEAYEHTIIINGLSKSHAMTGWRIGYSASPREVAKVISAMQSHCTSNPNSIAQFAAAEALRGPKEDTALMRQEFKRRRNEMVRLINEIPGVHCMMPGGAFYCMMYIGDLFGKKHGDAQIDGSMALCNRLLEAKKVAMVPGIAFGDDRWVRLSYATSMANITEGLHRFAEFVGELHD